ncbi:DUF3854 domain-containing protein [Phormidesmis priestleyi ULC007]|uniref:DUF3854 domain-containing protein n=1 Tax=Phormidesmis priestleyi ULC007 TaxID=1920490 RepID=A0A2T1D253_9CYAN|nr:DUF3854 domain-containing protein [Phormidesmis priestleyi]PSB14582.1 DUF3854 domain-containing protein [Phormidesmis priestleyi ULC007]
MSASILQTTPTLETFSQRFEHECIVGSEIDSCLYSAAIEIVEDTGYFEPNEFLGQKVSRQWQTHKPHNYRALAVFLNEDDDPWQAKPEHPRVNHKTGKEQKYESIKGRGARAFTPPVTVGIYRKITERNSIAQEDLWLKLLVEAARQNELDTLLQKWSGSGASQLTIERGAIAGMGFSSSSSKNFIQNQALEKLQKLLQPNTQELHSLQQGNPTQEVLAALCCFVANLPSRTRVPNFWKWLEQRVDIPLILTEGGKKSLCLLSQGYVAIALYGARGGVVENEVIGGEKVRKLKPELIHDLQRFAVPKRSITIALDQDDRIKTIAILNQL